MTSTDEQNLECDCVHHDVVVDIIFKMGNRLKYLGNYRNKEYSKFERYQEEEIIRIYGMVHHKEFNPYLDEVADFPEFEFRYLEYDICTENIMTLSYDSISGLVDPVDCPLHKPGNQQNET